MEREGDWWNKTRSDPPRTTILGCNKPEKGKERRTENKLEVREKEKRTRAKIEGGMEGEKDDCPASTRKENAKAMLNQPMTFGCFR